MVNSKRVNRTLYSQSKGVRVDNQVQVAKIEDLRSLNQVSAVGGMSRIHNDTAVII